MDETSGGSDARLAGALAALFAAVGVLAGLDVAADLREGTSPGHVSVEIGVAALGLTGAVWMASRYMALRRDARALAARAVRLEARVRDSVREAESWKREAADLIAGLGVAIDRQFDRWKLSPAEKDIALLLLKGLSHKEVAAVRGVGEATVRQQARTVYRKAGLSGRHDLAAFFLEDLLSPTAVEPAASAPPSSP